MSIADAFVLLRDEEIEELKTRARLYRHERSGAEVLSLENDDENKCFGVTFRTPPEDHTGIAHILEHAVLCGSAKYPVKKPFFELIKSSVKTFLNAMTYPDKTTYPVASTNLTDFYHLVDVYLDAVFFPKLGPEVLKQEGWHFALPTKDAPLKFGGVVFNEMKGQYSSPDYLLYRAGIEAIFPDTTYGVSSGGNPQYIPELTYEAFQQFHATLYHPSNARIFFYGDDDPEQRLTLLAAYLDQFEALASPPQIGLQTRFSEPRTVEQTYAVSPEEQGQKKGMVTLNWMLDAEQNQTRILALDILSYLLIGTPAAPLYQALMDSRLGESLTGSGYYHGLLQHTFSVGLKGIDPAQAATVETLIVETLTSLADTGFDDDQIAAALNTMEFALRENNTGSFPRGLSLMLRSLSTWLYEGDPLAPLRYEVPLAEVKAMLERREPIFQQLIRAHLLENSHRVRVLLRPDPEHAAREAAHEQARLDAARASMDDATLERLVAETQALKALQEQPDAPEELAKIPTLHIADLDRQAKQIPSELRTAGETPLLYHDLFTNGVIYLDLAFDLRSLPTELLPLAPIFARMLTEMGTTEEDFVRLLRRIGRHTGGIGATVMTANHLPTGDYLGRFTIRGKATVAQGPQLLAILQDVLLKLRLDDPERLRQIVTKSRVAKESGLVPAGNAYARKRSAARLEPSEWADEQMAGISSIFFLRELEQRIQADWPGVLAQLEALRQHLVNRSGLLLNLTLDEAGYRELAPQLAEFTAALPSSNYTPAIWSVSAAGPGEGLIIPARVNYVAQVVNLQRLGLEVGGAAGMVTRWLSIGYLLDRIRVQGGAYSAGCSYDRTSGLLAATSYRDPNLLKTLQVYAELGDFLRSVPLDDQTVERAIIGAIGDLDAYQLPDAKGTSAFLRHLCGVSDAWRQQMREAILDASAADFRAFAEAADALREHGVSCVVGSEETILNANRERPGLLTPVKVL
ncbi:insulinase family protein [Candidatus Viridilinea mediisalina]|uniref:Peptidase M16 n=1 Tax=Candidatus Viridilinea mediisalina TaxID=2024553 RepID=A0A2A6RIW1_9CHLR|nr:insulinase family protein [Candidatus Viridilinea mediisalina]PDW02836.1 peptidase M16 [Candidatus Viridilinea mediisalina]